MQSHPFDGDGINPELFKVLGRVNRASTSDSGLTFLVPDTILYYGCASFWYYFDRNTKSLQKHPARNLEKNLVFEHFGKSRKTAKSGIVAQFATWRSKKLDIRYFTRDELRAFLFTDRRQDLFGILQKYVEPRGERAEMLQVIWSPTLSFAVRRVNTAKIYDRTLAAGARCCTFDGPSHQCEEYFCNEHTTRMLAEHCKCIVALFGALEPQHTLGRVVCYLRQDASDRFWLYFTTSVRVIERPNTDALELKRISSAGRSRAPLVNPLMIFSTEEGNADGACNTTPASPTRRPLKVVYPPPPPRLLSPFFTPAADDGEEFIESYARAIERRIKRREARQARLAAENADLEVQLRALRHDGARLCSSHETRPSSVLSQARTAELQDVQSHGRAKRGDGHSDTTESTPNAAYSLNGSRSTSPVDIFGADAASPTPTPAPTPTPSLRTPKPLQAHAHSAAAGGGNGSGRLTPQLSFRRGRARRRAKVEAAEAFAVTARMQHAAEQCAASCAEFADALRAALVDHAAAACDIFYPLKDVLDGPRGGFRHRLRAGHGGRDSADGAAPSAPLPAALAVPRVLLVAMREFAPDTFAAVRLRPAHPDDGVQPPSESSTVSLTFAGRPLAAAMALIGGRLQHAAEENAAMWRARGQRRAAAVVTCEWQQLLQLIATRREGDATTTRCTTPGSWRGSPVDGPQGRLASSPGSTSSSFRSTAEATLPPFRLGETRASLLEEIRRGVALRKVGSQRRGVGHGGSGQRIKAVSFEGHMTAPEERRPSPPPLAPEPSPPRVLPPLPSPTPPAGKPPPPPPPPTNQAPAGRLGEQEGEVPRERTPRTLTSAGCSPSSSPAVVGSGSSDAGEEEVAPQREPQRHDDSHETYSDEPNSVPCAAHENAVATQGLDQTMSEDTPPWLL